MQEFLQFFESLSSIQKLIWIVICLSISWLLETGFPLVSFNYNKWRHAGINLIFLGTSMFLNILFGLATVSIFLWLEDHNFGLLNQLKLPIWCELVIAIMLLDLIAQYIAHRMLHKIKWMWKLHMVHHSDTHVDATTGTRHHPGDYIIRELFALIAIFISGMPVAFYLIYRILSIFFTYFTHANWNIPTGIDKALSYIFVSPNMHKFHHHFERPWTDTNFGNIFSLWDRALGTFIYDDPRKIKYGLDVLDPDTDEDVIYQFTLPFDSSIKTDY